MQIPATRATSSGSVSELAYTPMTSADFGTVACWATSTVGHQKYPCLFEIVPASEIYLFLLNKLKNNLKQTFFFS